MRSTRFVALVLFCALAPRAAMAQHEAGTGATPGVLQLWQALEKAFSTPELDALRIEAAALRTRIDGAASLPPPVFEAQLSPWPASNRFGDTRAYTVGLAQLFPGPGKRELRVALAEKDAEVAAAAFAVRSRQVATEVKHAYMDLWLARRSREIVETTLPILEQMAEATELKFTSGGASQQDVVKAVADLTRLHQDRVIYTGQALDAETRLNRLLNRRPGARVDALTDFPELRLLPPPERLMDLANERQPVFRHARATVARAEAVVAVAGQDVRPDYTLRAGYMAIPGTPGSWVTSVGLTWPAAPWARKGVEAQIAESQARLSAARSSAQAFTNEIRSKVFAAWARMKTAEERAALVRTTLLPQVTHALEVSFVAYGHNRANFVDVVDAQRMLITTRLEYQTAIVDFHRGLVDLEEAIGQELPRQFLQVIELPTPNRPTPKAIVPPAPLGAPKVATPPAGPESR